MVPICNNGVINMRYIGVDSIIIRLIKFQTRNRITINKK